MFAQVQSIRPAASTRASASSTRPIVVARAIQSVQANTVPTPQQPIHDHYEQTIRLFKAGCFVTAASLALVSGLLICEPADANDLGAQVFNGNCAACHMGGRNSVIPEKTLDKEALEKYLAGGFKLESIVYQVQNGKGAMPAWADRLDDDEIDAVAKYVFDKASTASWD